MLNLKCRPLLSGVCTITLGTASTEASSSATRPGSVGERLLFGTPVHGVIQSEAAGDVRAFIVPAYPRASI